MELLKRKIAEKGKIFPGNILKVDSFLNHQMDIEFLDKVGEEYYERFKNDGVNKILTIEASGIAIACATARYFKAPVLFAKKNKTKNIASDVYSSNVVSYTHGREYTVIVSKQFLSKDDRVIIVDDFLANGCAMIGLIDIVKQSGATLVGVGAVIEKGFQGGGDKLREEGIRVESLAIVDEMSDDHITYRE
ncbi:MAG: xanthine phosphoribosyltransferase [Ruminococcaceae bacterium]|nr:xanthine phosphoribosyltransferase [Oscillospiraceae bacterium]